jgi:Xaa-Pro dipeptidase
VNQKEIDNMPSKQLFAEHIASLENNYQSALQFCGISEENSILVHSGSEQFYYADDRAIAFQAYGHFLHWVPINRPDQFLLFTPGQRPRYLQVTPSDYWHDQTIDNADWWTDSLNIINLDRVEDIAKYIDSANTIYVGQEPEMAQALLGDQLKVNSKPLLHYLNYQRAYKSDYEVSQLRMANAKALVGHKAAEDAFKEGLSEYGIHQAYLQACEILEYEAPYTNIVALDDRSAILHYQNKRRGNAMDSQVLLIDAGYRLNNYGSDITRTYAKDSAHPVFCSLLEGMESLETELVDSIEVGKNYTEIHASTLRRVGALLRQLELVNADDDVMLEMKLPQLFMPHGVGHLLGLQVHDVAGFQQDLAGTMKAAPEHSPALRNTRAVEENMVFTIEPGCYFIPLLLEPQRNTAIGEMLNWKLIDELYPYGGIRIEDNISVTKSGIENLTRKPHQNP